MPKTQQNFLLVLTCSITVQSFINFNKLQFRGCHNRWRHWGNFPKHESPKKQNFTHSLVCKILGHIQVPKKAIHLEGRKRKMAKLYRYTSHCSGLTTGVKEQSFSLCVFSQQRCPLSCGWLLKWERGKTKTTANCNHYKSWLRTQKDSSGQLITSAQKLCLVIYGNIQI